MPLNLAPFRFRTVYEKDGGPIAGVTVGPGRLWDGTPCFDAGARLRQGLRPTETPRLQLYAALDGGGTASSRTVACFKAISEALERYAFFEASVGRDREAYGFAVDDSTTGMAAFPGLTAAPARAIARLEAIERWAVLEWWRGALPARVRGQATPDGGSLEVVTPFRNCSVAVLWHRSKESGLLSYGFAAAEDPARSAAKAAIELTRNLRVLGAFFKESSVRPDSYDRTTLDSYMERRLIFFSTSEGVRLFQERVATSLGLDPRPGAEPEVLIDREILGPWSRYAHVWRILLRHTQGAETDFERDDVFAF